MAFDLGSGLEGKSVLVTGGTGGIGREVCLAFAAAGSRVAVVDLDQQRVDAVVAEMEGGPHLGIAYDLQPVAGHAALIAKVVAEFGRLDVLVQTAAVLVRRPSVFEVTRSRLGHPARRQSQGLVLPLPGGGAHHEGAGHGRPHHQLHVAGLAERRLRRLGRLCGVQGRHRVDDARPCALAGQGRASPSMPSRPARPTPR